MKTWVLLQLPIELPIERRKTDRNSRSQHQCISDNPQEIRLAKSGSLVERNLSARNFVASAFGYT